MKKRTVKIGLLCLALAVLIPVMAFANRMVNILTSYQYVTEGHIMSSEEREEYLASEADDTLSNSSAQEISDADAQFKKFLEENSEMLKPGVTEYQKPYVLGEFVKAIAPEYTASYAKVIKKAGGDQ